METVLEANLEKFEKAVLGQLEGQIYEWASLRKLVYEWENAELLNNPSPALLEEHRRKIESMIRYGQMFILATSHPDFPRADLAEMVQSTLWLLRDQYQALHAPAIQQEEADRILAAVFPDER